MSQFFQIHPENPQQRLIKQAVEIINNSFHAATSLEMDGHAVEAEVSARFEGEQVEGTLKLQNSPAARTELERALVLDPNSADAKRMLGEMK